jgi:hypothetical protein
MASSSLPRQPDRALINQHVNPYQEFPSLRRGFTLEGKALKFSLVLLKAELRQLNRTQFPSLGIFVSKIVGNRKN